MPRQRPIPDLNPGQRQRLLELEEAGRGGISAQDNLLLLMRALARRGLAEIKPGYERVYIITEAGKNYIAQRIRHNGQVQK